MILAYIVTLVFDSFQYANMEGEGLGVILVSLTASQQVYTFHLVSMWFTSHVIVTVLSHCVPQDGWTALTWASFNGKADAVRELLSGGAQVDLQNKVSHNIN